MNKTFSLCATIFGLLSGGISLLGFVVAVCRPHLPSNKIQKLETLLQETETTVKDAVEAGLLVPEFAEWTEEQLMVLRERTCTYRARVYRATTLCHDCTEFLRGTSTAIGRICRSVKKLKAVVITSSEERRLTQTSPVNTLASNPATQVTQLPPPPPDTEDHLTPPPPVLVRSRPPALPAPKSENMPIGSLEQARIRENYTDGSLSSDILGNSSWSDSEV